MNVLVSDRVTVTVEAVGDGRVRLRYEAHNGGLDGEVRDLVMDAQRATAIARALLAVAGPVPR